MHRGTTGLILAGLLAAAPLAAGAQDVTKGQAVFKAQKCATCHKIGTTGGKLAPELTKVGTKRDKGWLEKYLVNPKSINPKNIMPAVKVPDPDREALIAYLLSLR